ncbi:transcriptional regulator [Pseudooctadecabacter jejudonensis]|nr:transcriptional regulator [Pseudooctadecabacter jejudonensis]
MTFQRQLNSVELRDRLGGISTMTLWRMGQDETLNFPEPSRIRGRRYWSEAALATWMEQQGGAQ